MATSPTVHPLTDADKNQDGRISLDELIAATPPPVPMPPDCVHPHDGLARSGRLFGGIVADVRRRLNAKVYMSDWRDGANLKSLAAGLYMFFGCLAPGIAFGATVDTETGGRMGVVEYLISQGVTGVIFALVSGQPLIILRPTGPITVFTISLYTMADSLGVDFLQLYAWVGLWVGVIMIVVAVTDSCSLVKWCGIFTGDIFGFFVSVIFVSIAVENIAANFDEVGVWGYDGCFLMLIIAILTFVCSIQLAGMKSSAFFTATIRERLAEFAVPIAIFALAAARQVYPSVDADMLSLPATIQLTRGTNSSLLVPLLGDAASTGGTAGAAPGWLPWVGLGFGAFLSLLFFVDHNVTSLLTQSSEHRLAKGNAYHWNFLLVAAFNIVMPLFGCPYVTGSLPHSPQFAQALAIKEVVIQGGERRQRILRVHENRVAPLLANVLVLGALFLTSALGNVPLATLDGLFLFMGFSGLPGNNVYQRAKLLLMERSMHPPSRFSHLPLAKVHAYTLLQLSIVGLLFLISRTPVALSFPIFVILTIPLRLRLPRLTNGFFSEADLAALDGTDEPDEPGGVPPKAAAAATAEAVRTDDAMSA